MLTLLPSLKTNYFGWIAVFVIRLMCFEPEVWTKSVIDTRLARQLVVLIFSYKINKQSEMYNVSTLSIIDGWL